MVRIEACPGCSGKGKVKCPVCDGKGFIYPRGYKESIDCPGCLGAGRLICKMRGGGGSLLADTQPAKA